MKTLKQFINEASTNAEDIAMIKKFVGDNFYCVPKISKKPNKDGMYEVQSSSYLEVRKKNIESFTNGMFVWTKVKDYCWIENCTNLKSLEGAPSIVGKGFKCINCPSITSLKGAPENVGKDFICVDCKSLTSLEGAPKMVNGDFSCARCESLTSLDGAPEMVKGSFVCSDCGKKFSEDEVANVCKVNANIIV